MTSFVDDLKALQKHGVPNFDQDINDATDEHILTLQRRRYNQINIMHWHLVVFVRRTLRSQKFRNYFCYMKKIQLHFYLQTNIFIEKSALDYSFAVKNIMEFCLKL